MKVDFHEISTKYSLKNESTSNKKKQEHAGTKLNFNREAMCVQVWEHVAVCWISAFLVHTVVFHQLTSITA